MSSTIEVLKQLIQLEERRASLQQQLANLDLQINSRKRGLIGGAPQAAAKAVQKSVPKVAPKPAVKAKSASKPSPVSKAPAKTAPPKAPKPASKPAAKPAGKTSKGFQRGALVDNILAALKAAGAKGATIKDLSAKFGAPYRNIQVWFATTGKKHKEIKKIAPATYRLK